MAISIRCPECQTESSIQVARAGRFRVRCPKCSATFPVTVPEGEGAAPEVASPQTAADAITREIPRNLVGVLPETQAPASSPASDVGPIDDPRPSTGSIDPPFQPPRSLGGYRVGRRLGPLRVGAAFEAIRRATGRRVALTVVKPRWAAEPRFVARFAREAFAAGHLDHPNLIPPADLGVDRGFAFTAADALGGESLAEPAGREGFDRTARAAAVLHAARGLRQAHEQGIYHRDLGLDKLRVDPAGQIQLVGVGVGLTPDSPDGPAVAPVALAGSPPVAAPEPFAAGFAREDVAGLGRMLRSLVGGSQGDRAIPPGLALVIRRMIGEGPEAGFLDLGAAVRALEAELGVAGAFLPRDEEAAEFESCARSFASVPLANLRPWITAGSAGLLGLFAVLMLRGHPLSALGALAFGAIVATATLAIRRYHQGREPLLDRARDLLLGGTWGDLVTVLASVGLVVAALVATGLLGFWIFLTILGVSLATARVYALDRPVEQARADPIARATALIRSLRRQGVDEEAIRRFACRQGGTRWEEFFEALFGYEALRSARTRWGLDAGGKRQPQFARWRDPIAAALDARLANRRESRLRSLFEVIEERNLEARGINLLTARRKSRRIAEALLAYSRNHRRLGAADAEAPLMDGLNRVAVRPDDYLTTAESEEQAGPPLWREILEAVGRVCFGARTRFLVGGVALAGCLLWMHQNDLISAEKIKAAGLNATADSDQAIADARKIGQEILAGIQGVADATTETKTLELAGLPPGIARRLDGYGLGVAGLILVISAGFGGVRIAAFAIPGALVAAFGPRFIDASARPLGPTSLLAMAVGAGLFALGVAIGKARG